MPKYHMSDGEPKPCSAGEGNCPLGADGEEPPHFEGDKQGAKAWAEQQNAERAGGSFGGKSPQNAGQSAGSENDDQKLKRAQDMFARFSKRDDYASYGYPAERKRMLESGHGAERARETDKHLMDHMDREGLSEEQMFDWSNSKMGRHYGTIIADDVITEGGPDRYLLKRGESVEQAADRVNRENDVIRQEKKRQRKVEEARAEHHRIIGRKGEGDSSGPRFIDSVMQSENGMSSVMEKFSQREEHQGFGYIGERRRMLEENPASESARQADAVLTMHAHQEGLSEEEVFRWANSKMGRHYANSAFSLGTSSQAVRQRKFAETCLPLKNESVEQTAERCEAEAALLRLDEDPHRHRNQRVRWPER